jgi:multiple sugar transport system substrate-binding protein
MDKLTTLEGGIGCRRSTWDDAEVNQAIPFYHQLAHLHQYARELPRSRELPRLVHVIDSAIQRALSSDEPSASILRQAQAQASAIKL